MVGAPYNQIISYSDVSSFVYISENVMGNAASSSIYSTKLETGPRKPCALSSSNWTTEKINRILSKSWTQSPQQEENFHQPIGKESYLIER